MKFVPDLVTMPLAQLSLRVPMAYGLSEGETSNGALTRRWHRSQVALIMPAVVERGLPWETDNS